jgi:hypothetical protein
MDLPNRPSPLGGFALGMGSLKKRALKQKFTELDLSLKSSLWLENIANRLRNIDTYRLHVPTPEERDEMRIPESSERLNLQHKKDFIILCGGYAGVRFTSEVIRLFKIIVSFNFSFL